MIKLKIYKKIFICYDTIAEYATLIRKMGFYQYLQKGYSSLPSNFRAIIAKLQSVFMKIRRWKIEIKNINTRNSSNKKL